MSVLTGRKSVICVAKEEVSAMTINERRRIERKIAAYKAVSTRYKNRGQAAKAAWSTRRVKELEKLIG